eukprot:TRINITY_DN8763_c0_g1_i1.p1 TRINITY_DN8763_c0_g1~~TRINITY_DN8763_c0_g1_i1.p1  ORF type:complete len:381 (-),score=55.19 TRINITY_DN8763_c0_g1_i1:332-1444(-)
METMQELLDSAKAWAFLVATVLLVIYPLALLAWMALEGRSAASKQTLPVQTLQIAVQKQKRVARHHVPSRHVRFLSILKISTCLMAIALPACTFIAKNNFQQGKRGREHVLQVETKSAEVVTKAARVHSTATLPSGIVSASDTSLWHDVGLFVKTWLDNETELYRYVNEIPMGSMQKFEVQVDAPYNAICEDAKGSKSLAAFGKPLPFNYGCFPQTFRDPDKLDAIYDARGDDDPLDVLDLSTVATQTGDIVTCRPLGAVCLIDEGLCDWKILAVNVKAPGALADAHSMEDIERIAPGRTEECLSWMRELKCFGKEECLLHAEIHDADTAVQIIKGDHLSWKQLVAKVGTNGTSKGHWIQPPVTHGATLP